MHLLQRVSGESRGCGSLDFALAFEGVECQGDVDESISMSSGSLSPDLGAMWRYGCRKRPDWDSDIGTWTEDQEISGNDTRSTASLGSAHSGKGGGPFWILGTSWDCARWPADGTFPVNTDHAVSSSSSMLRTSRCVPCGMSSGTSSDEEFEEHNVKNLHLEVVGEGW